ncbi:polysaccharide pyruvyl transferase family protein [[Limnothrix rosea] IAM M-220]|uniref:polysaccharide pyruvyl transferase family protein n=1 Tax=[Limnothrix rosea] IAM M-220 TaxID=454133 RepID=UPI001559BABF|nr:polysaccharide pyruvyl transferase family protein [[Limnothrix rosea] IAM M-220]
MIIENAVKTELSKIFMDRDILSISTQKYLRANQVKLVKDSSFTFVGGTNLLSSNMEQYRQWKLSPLDIYRVKNVILFGVGWWQYQNPPNLYTRLLLKSVLSHQYLHSVRDGYTEKQLRFAGFKNVVNTGCPTMWPLAHLKQEEIPPLKAPSVLLMLTDYSKRPSIDSQLIRLLFDKYETVFVWPQGRQDLEYIRSFNKPFKILGHSFNSLNQFLSSGVKFDYIGTRLHGGIKCLLARKRSLILEIDNRAKEIARDTNLPTAERDDFAHVSAWIEKPFSIDIRLNIDNIMLWKKQFNATNVS